MTWHDIDLRYNTKDKSQKVKNPIRLTEILKPVLWRPIGILKGKLKKCRKYMQYIHLILNNRYLEYVSNFYISVIKYNPNKSEAKYLNIKCIK